MLLTWVYFVLNGHCVLMDLIFHLQNISLITGIFVYATTAYAIKKARDTQKYAVVSSIIISFQILLGMLVVNTKLQPLLVATHLSTGVLLFAMILMTFLSAYKIKEKKSPI